MPTDALSVIHRESVKPEWVDYNGHMNVAYYVLIFDHATDAFLADIGMTDALRNETGSSVFVAEAHIRYHNEAMQGETVAIQSQLIDWDKKRLHVFHTMTDDDGERILATNELMILQVNLNDRRVGPFPPHVQGKIEPVFDAHRQLPRPADVGRIIGIRHKS